MSNTPSSAEMGQERCEMIPFKAGITGINKLDCVHGDNVNHNKSLATNKWKMQTHTNHVYITPYD
jgi:hypothetical protein